VLKLRARPIEQGGGDGARAQFEHKCLAGKGRRCGNHYIKDDAPAEQPGVGGQRRDPRQAAL